MEEKGSKLITKQSAVTYLGSKKETNPLNWLLLKFKQSSFFSSNIVAMITLLLIVAVFLSGCVGQPTAKIEKPTPTPAPQPTPVAVEGNPEFTHDLNQALDDLSQVE